MRQTCIGAIGSIFYTRLPHLRARVWTLVLPVGLLCGPAKSASAATDLTLNGHFVARATKLQPGPSKAAVRHAVPESLPPLPSLPAAPLYSETFWTAFADQDLITLRQAAQTEPEARFAEAMTLLAAGNVESAEADFIAVSQQQNDLNVAVAAQVMLATTLRYQRKWTELRDLSMNSKLGADDQRITSDLESWGKAFAGAERELATLPDKRVTLPLKITAVGTPMIRVRLNGKAYDFWLDTGASMTVISSGVAEDARIVALSQDVLNVRTFAGSAPVKAAILQRLELGPIVLANSPAVIIDESLMYLRTSAEGVPQRGIRVDGIIGWDTIRQFDLTMDYLEGWITLSRPEQRSMTAAQQNLSWLGRPFVELRSRAGNLHFTLDTGSQTTFLNAAVLERTPMTTRSSDNHVFGIARTGRQTTRVVPFMAVEVGGQSLKLQDVIIYGPVHSGLINSDGILGSDMARYGQIHIDATNGVFTIGESRNADDATE
jgi:predicted aspartyl protease